MKTFASMVGRVLMHVPECPAPMVEHYLRESAIELCRRSNVWNETLPAVTLTSADFPYVVTPPADAVVCKVVSVTPAAGVPLDPIDERAAALKDGQWKTTTGPLSAFIEKPRGTVSLVPLPTGSTAIVLCASYEPAETATGIEDWIYVEHRNTIVSGAVSNLAALPNKPWTSPEIAAYHGTIFDAGINDASLDMSLNSINAPRRTSPNPLS